MQTTATLANTQVVRDCYRYFNEGNIEELLNQLNDNIEFNVPGPREIPWSGLRTGKKAVQEFFGIVNDNLEFQKMEPREFIEQGNKVIALGYWEAKAKKTSRTAKGDWAMAFTLKNGKVSRMQEYSDTYTTVEALKTVTGKSSGN